MLKKGFFAKFPTKILEIKTLIDFSISDYLAIIFYFVAIYIAGFFRKFNQKESNLENYLIAGRKISLPAFVATIVCTWYGGILGVGEYSYQNGLVNWFVWGASYYIFAGIYAFVFAGKIRKDFTDYTISDRIYRKYGRKVGLVSAFVFLISTSPASYFLMLGILFNIFFPQFSIDFWIISGAFLSVIYVYKGGLPSVIKTDFIQFILMFAGFFVILPFCYFQFGGIDFLTAKLPETHLTLTGTLEPQTILMWMFLGIITFVDPSFYQRCLAVETPQKAKKGILIAILFWCFFDFMTTTAGLYARAILPNIDPVKSYPLLADLVLPTFFKGLFFVGMLATVMSTIDSYTFLSALVFGKDILARFSGKENDVEAVEKFTKYGLVVTFLVGVVLATSFESIIDYWKTIGSLAIASLLLPIILSFSEKPPNSTTTISGIVISFFVTFFANHFKFKIFGISEPIYYGLLVSCLIFGVGKVLEIVMSKQE
ncbi:sodium:solute symporter family protein [bacterium]|nr:sodium:solute symporter family protein [bacterium]